MAMLSLLSSLTNYPKWHCQIVGEMFSMMNVPSNQPIKKESLAPLDKWGGKAGFAKEIAPFVSLFHFKKEKRKSCATDYIYLHD